MSKPPPQSSFPFHPQTYSQRANAISAKASKARRSSSLRVIGQREIVADAEFRNKASGDVPLTRADCPTPALDVMKVSISRPYCHHIRCRWHLAMEDGEHRAGRPGLGNVPRDSMGLTLPSIGHAGDDRPGATLRPDWLRVRALEVATEVKAYVARSGMGYELSEVRNGTFDYWLSRLHEGEPVDVFDNYSVLGDGSDFIHIAVATLSADGSLAFDRELPEYVLSSADGIRLKRRRPISSCALDLIDVDGALANTQIGDAIGRHRTLAARIVRRALEKAIENAEGMGVSREDLLNGLREIGAG